MTDLRWPNEVIIFYIQTVKVQHRCDIIRFCKNTHGSSFIAVAQWIMTIFYYKWQKTLFEMCCSALSRDFVSSLWSQNSRLRRETMFQQQWCGWFVGFDQDLGAGGSNSYAFMYIYCPTGQHWVFKWMCAATVVWEILGKLNTRWAAAFWFDFRGRALQM